MLIGKLRVWARASGGAFPVDGRPGYTRLDELGPNELGRIRWARLKSVSRAVEKIFRVYKEVPLRSARPDTCLCKRRNPLGALFYSSMGRPLTPFRKWELTPHPTSGEVIFAFFCRMSLCW